MKATNAFERNQRANFEEEEVEYPNHSGIKNVLLPLKFIFSLQERLTS